MRRIQRREGGMGANRRSKKTGKEKVTKLDRRDRTSHWRVSRPCRVGARCSRGSTWPRVAMPWEGTWSIGRRPWCDTETPSDFDTGRGGPGRASRSSQRHTPPWRRGVEPWPALRRNRRPFPQRYTPDHRRYRRHSGPEAGPPARRSYGDKEETYGVGGIDGRGTRDVLGDYNLIPADVV